MYKVDRSILILLYLDNLVCPSKLKLNCANVMYSKQCHPNYDCSYAGPQFVCCETGCSGDSKYVCVPEGKYKYTKEYFLLSA